MVVVELEVLVVVGSSCSVVVVVESAGGSLVDVEVGAEVDVEVDVEAVVVDEDDVVDVVSPPLVVDVASVVVVESLRTIEVADITPDVLDVTAFVSSTGHDVPRATSVVTYSGVEVDTRSDDELRFSLLSDDPSLPVRPASSCGVPAVLRSSTDPWSDMSLTSETIVWS